MRSFIIPSTPGDILDQLSPPAGCRSAYRNKTSLLLSCFIEEAYISKLASPCQYNSARLPPRQRPRTVCCSLFRQHVTVIVHHRSAPPARRRSSTKRIAPIGYRLIACRLVNISKLARLRTHVIRSKASCLEVSVADICLSTISIIGVVQWPH